MDGPLAFYLLMFVPPLVVAFGAQLVRPDAPRLKVIARSALGWCIFVTLVLVAVRVSVAGSADMSGVAVVLLIFGTIGLFVSLFGAILGSELASLLRRVLRRSS